MSQCNCAEKVVIVVSPPIRMKPSQETKAKLELGPPSSVSASELPELGASEFALLEFHLRNVGAEQNRL